MATRDLIKAFGILTLGTLALYSLLRLARVDPPRMLLGVALFILLGGLGLISESRP